MKRDELSEPLRGAEIELRREQPQEWTPNTVIGIIVDAFESGGEKKATELISERHNAALAAERNEAAKLRLEIQRLAAMNAERESQLNAERDNAEAWRLVAKGKHIEKERE